MNDDETAGGSSKDAAETDLSLDTVMFWWQASQRRWGGYAHDEYAARRLAVDHLSLYARERNGLLIWRAFREFRRRGIAVPEPIMSHLDQWAAALEEASGPREIATAIEMSHATGGGAQAAAQLGKIAETRRLVSEISRLTPAAGGSLSEKQAIDRVAQRWGLSFKATEKRFYAWKRKTKALEAQADVSPGADLTHQWVNHATYPDQPV